mgnify:FL=1|jgi:iron complex outermembrane receptor protein
MRSNRTRHHALCTAVAMAASMLAADISLAQQGIEEIVVTARKREENLQDVPMAISAFTAEQLQNSQVDNITDLQKMTPNITVNETSGLVAGVVQVFIRGIGNDPGFDQGVGIYVDDVYLNTATGALLEVYDVERIEVLKGPQGNLYGRNTIGGAIKYVSREPSNELEAGLEGQLGTDDLLRLRGNVSGPLLEDVLFGGFAFSVKDRDGYQTNQYDGSEWADSDVQAFRGTLLWTPTEDLTLKVVADYSDDQSKPNIPNRVALNVAGINGISTPVTLANTIYGPGTAPFDGASDVSLPPDEDTVNTAHVVNGYDQTELKTSSVAGTITWDVNEAVTLKSVTAFRDVENPRAFDFDGSAQEFINTISSPQNEDFSQEFQFNYASDKLHIVAGAYYLDGSYTIEDPGFTLQTARLRFWSDHRKTTYQDDRDLESMSVYGTAEWEFVEDWQLSLGGRYTEDKKDIDIQGTVVETFYPFALTRVGSALVPLAIRPGQEGFVQTRPQFVTWIPNGGLQTLINTELPTDPAVSRAFITQALTVTYEEPLVSDDEWNEFSPSIKLTHFMNEDVMVYAGYSSGFKSGGFATTGNIVRSYEPEIVDSYSLGLKSTLLDGTLRLNTELFFNDYQDKQLTTIDLIDGALISTQDNVGKVETYGAEAEIMWATPLDGLMANLNVGYLDSEIKEYLQTVAGGGTIDISDDRVLGLSPEWTAQARLSYDFDVGSAGAMLLSADVAYRDEMYTDSPVDTTSAFRVQSLSDDLTTYNALVAFTTASQKWRFALEGKNLSDERSLVNAYVVSNFMTGGYNRERTWAFSVGYTY